MASKQLESILASMPPATATKSMVVKNNLSVMTGLEENKEIEKTIKKTEEKLVRIVATANQEIKDELKKIARENNETETIIILKALRAFGFQSIEDSMLVDKRTLR